jgi:hypothetical protein
MHQHGQIIELLLLMIATHNVFGVYRSMRFLQNQFMLPVSSKTCCVLKRPDHRHREQQFRRSPKVLLYRPNFYKARRA